MLEKQVPFKHELIDLGHKPRKFLDLYASVSDDVAKVPLIELLDGTVVIESQVVARRIAIDFSTGTDLLPPSETYHIDRFIGLWTGKVETTYYNVLRATSESEARMELAGFVAALAEVESALWERRLESS